MTDRLFDATKFGVSDDPPPDRSGMTEPPITVTIGSTWKLMQRHGHPEVHAIRKSWMDSGSYEAFCGAIGGLFTAEPGSRVAACRKCIERGAPR